MSSPLTAASVIPPLDPEAKLPTSPVTNDAGENFDLVQKLRDQAQGPVVVLPIFARCKGACPAFAQGLRLAALDLKERFNGVSVVIFSFDPQDSIEVLQKFRETQRL